MNLNMARSIIVCACAASRGGCRGCRGETEGEQAADGSQAWQLASDGKQDSVQCMPSGSSQKKISAKSACKRCRTTDMRPPLRLAINILLRKTLTCALSVRLQRRTLSSILSKMPMLPAPEIRIQPSGVHVRVLIEVVCPSKTAVQLLSATRQRRIVVSSLAEAMALLSGEKTRADTVLKCPSSLAVQVLSARLQRLME